MSSLICVSYPGIMYNGNPIYCMCMGTGCRQLFSTGVSETKTIIIITHTMEDGL